MNSNPRLFRHGDLLICEMGFVPSFAKPISTNIIAEGEKTGHNHVLNGSHQIYETPDKQILFTAEQDVSLKHQEHSTLKIKEGNYVVVKELEYNVFKNIQEEVID